MKKQYLFIILALLMLLSACGKSVNAPVIEEVDEEENELKDWGFEVTTEQDESALHVKMTVTNNLEEKQSIDFSSGQKYEVVLRSNGEEVYRYSDGKMFTMAIITEGFEPGESKTYEQLIPLDGTLAGEYELTAELVVAAVNGESVADSIFKQVTMVEVK
ncbi:BsuPI-related putative proteinase inhibitor [Bacillus suaedae]|uniref:Intracellular proteinase inhibitor BsuPI domain-containing protein n=1 Tax=Halalkalibacter suaedae TaxID=2822140 RepID=A0A941ALN3_9BACI|nr:BsuPI-related putative proteinase inhibitor [Bacillus suaedae]MBP3949585.1 hypothetical protein [Bacillus suaedae]